MVPLEVGVGPFQYLLHLRRDRFGMNLPLIVIQIIGQRSGIFLIDKNNRILRGNARTIRKFGLRDDVQNELLFSETLRSKSLLAMTSSLSL